MLGSDGHIVKTLVVKLTDRPATTCDAGDYRQLEVISELGDSGIPKLISPAYEVNGAALRIQLRTAMCDNVYAVIGGVTDTGFDGVHVEEVLVAPRDSSTAVLRAYGVPLPD